MQLKAFLEKNCLTIDEVAKLWGITRSTLYRIVSGKRWPSPLVQIRAHEISRGTVSLEDWIETCRDLLIADGVVAKRNRKSRNENGPQTQE